MNKSEELDPYSPTETWAELSKTEVVQVVENTYPKKQPPNTLRLVCISDTHNNTDSMPALPYGDVLIHAGDLTKIGTRSNVNHAKAWLLR